VPVNICLLFGDSAIEILFSLRLLLFDRDILLLLLSEFYLNEFCFGEMLSCFRLGVYLFGDFGEDLDLCMLLLP
jgi:hypothetical protein